MRGERAFFFPRDDARGWVQEGMTSPASSAGGIQNSPILLRKFLINYVPNLGKMLATTDYCFFGDDGVAWDRCGTDLIASIFYRRYAIRHRAAPILAMGLPVAST